MNGRDGLGDILVQGRLQVSQGIHDVETVRLVQVPAHVFHLVGIIGFCSAATVYTRQAEGDAAVFRALPVVEGRNLSRVLPILESGFQRDVEIHSGKVMHVIPRCVSHDADIVVGLAALDAHLHRLGGSDGQCELIKGRYLILTQRFAGLQSHHAHLGFTRESITRDGKSDIVFLYSTAFRGHGLPFLYDGLRLAAVRICVVFLFTSCQKAENHSRGGHPVS